MQRNVIRTVEPSDVFAAFEDAKTAGRRVIPLLGSGISVESGIPTSAALADYIVTVYALANKRGWENCREYLRKWGWPHRHDAAIDWITHEPSGHFSTLESQFQKSRIELYRRTVRDELRRCSPLYVQMADEHLNTLVTDRARVTDYRSLLATVTHNDTNLIDSFFDHFVRLRSPSTAHQYLAFVAQLLRIDLILTTNFDALIETALRNEGLAPTVYEIPREGTIPSQLLLQNQSISVVKLHGGTHSLRTGFDLDDPLPLSALDEARAYFRARAIECEGAAGSDKARNREGARLDPLLLVIGYSGHDRRVMDVVVAHVATWVHGPPNVIWVSRDGRVPTLLNEAASSAMSFSDMTTSARVVRRSEPAYLCHYKDGQRFLQELYQVVESQHAVSRTSYRAITLVPREPSPPSPRVERAMHEERSSNCRIFWADESGRGTSSAALKMISRDKSASKDVIWVDASDCATRAGLLSLIQNEFARLDRGLAPAARPLLLRDVDLLQNLEPRRSDPKLKESSIDDNDRWETEVAARWIVHAMRRGNYTLVVDSLGEFGVPHPGLIDEPYASADMRVLSDQRLEQRRRVLQLLGALYHRARDLGRSALVCAITPASRSQSEVTKPRHLLEQRVAQAVAAPRDDSDRGHRRELADDLVLLSDGRLRDFDVEIKQEGGSEAASEDRSSEARAEFTINHVKSLLAAGDRVMVAAGLMVCLASLFRRPCSRTALLVVFTRYLQRCKPAKRLWPRLDIEDPPTSERLLKLGRDALRHIQETKTEDARGWQLLARLEGGFYWMHMESRDQLYSRLVQPSFPDDTGPLWEQIDIAYLFDQIAMFAMRDVYERSHDPAAFVEYMHYRYLAILHYERAPVARKDLPAPWRERLRAFVGTVATEFENLRAHGRLPELLYHLRLLLDFLVRVDRSGRREKDFALLRDNLVQAVREYTGLLTFGGRIGEALSYCYWQAILLKASERTHRNGNFATAIDQCRVLLNDLLSERPARVVTATKKVVGALKAIEVGQKEGRKPTRRPTDLRTGGLAIHVAGLIVDPILASDTLIESAPRLLPDCQSLARWMACRRGQWRADLGEKLLRDASSRLERLSRSGGKVLDPRELAEIVEKYGLARARLIHLELTRLLASARFDWLASQDRQFSEVADLSSLDGDLSSVVSGCTLMTEQLRMGQSTIGGRRIQSYLYTLRAMALAYRGAHDQAAVNFRRAQAVLQRPAAPRDRAALALVLLSDAESRIYHARACIAKGLTSRKVNTPDAIAVSKWPLNSADAGSPNDRSDDLGAAGAQELEAASGFAEARSELESVRRLLDQVTALLSGSAAESKIHTYYEFLCAYAHYSWYELHESLRCGVAPIESASQFELQDRLSSAMDHVLRGLTGVERQSDWHVVLRLLFKRIELRWRRLYPSGMEEWTRLRRRSGLLDHPSRSGGSTPMSVVNE
ncbi:MAG: SIR2 family protein [Phycisphaerae bacterium]|nr:SIR2 family protein [Phycisphaerae bacterium]